MSRKSKFLKNVTSFSRYFLTMGLFIATAGFALILARGNTFTDEGISATGTIRLNSPTDEQLNVYLDEQLQRVTSNKTIENVLPGKYILRVQKEGYSSWEQEVEVIAGLVTDTNFRLFPDELQLTSLETKNISQLFYSKDRSRLFYTVVDSQIGANIGLWQLDLNSSSFGFSQGTTETKLSNLVGAFGVSARDATLQVIPSPDNRKLLLDTQAGYYVIDTSRYNEPTAATLLEIEYPITSIKWLKDSNNLMILSDRILIDYDILANSSTIISYNGDTTPVYAHTSGIVYYIENGELMQYSSGTKEAVDLVNVSLPEGMTEIIAPSENLQNLALKAGKSLFFLNIEQSFITEIGEYNVVSISPSGENLFIKDSEQIYAVDVTISQLRDSVRVDITPSQLPTNLAANSLRWSNNSSYIAFTVAKVETSDAILTADQLGNNINELLSQVDTKVVSFNLTPDSSGVLTLLQDGEKANIYKLDFAE